MANLDFILKDNGRVEYNKDLSINQYSNKADTIRLLTKTPYDIVNMNVTLPNNIQTTKKILIQQPVKSGEYWVYSYPVDLSITDIEIPSDKAIVKVSFFLYPDVNDQSIVNTSGVCYLPIIRNNSNAKPDGSVTESDLNTLTSEINDINEAISNLNIGEIDTAKNYNTSSGSIKNKFDNVDARLGNLQNDIDSIEKTLGSLDFGEGSVNTNLTLISNKISALEDADIKISSNIANNTSKLSEVSTSLATTNSNVTTLLTDVGNIKTNNVEINNTIRKNTEDIAEIRDDIIPNLQAGIRYEMVSSLPNNPKEGVVYIIKNTSGNETLPNDYYIEYLYINGRWEILGTTESTINLDEYYKAAEIDAKLDTFYATKSQVSDELRKYSTTDQISKAYYNKTFIDENIYTISEVNSEIDKVDTRIDNLDTGDLSNVKGKYIKNEKDAFEYKNLKNIPARATKLSQLENDGDGSVGSSFVTNTIMTSTLTNYATNSALKAVSDRVTENDNELDAIRENIDEVEDNLSATTETANIALAIAQAKQYSIVFDTKENMVNYLKTKDKQYSSNNDANENLIAIGTELIIKDNNVPDYWIAAIYSSPQTYQSKFGEVFEDVWFGVEANEGKIDLSAYATYEYVDGQFRTNLVKYIDDRDATKVDLSAKSSEINDASTDTQWASALAVKNHVALTKEALDKDIADNSNKIAVLRVDLTTTNETVAAHKAELDAKDLEIEGRLDVHDSAISTLNTNLQKEATTRENADNVLQSNINTLDTDLQSYKEYAEERYLDHSEYISRSEGIIDYMDTTDRTKVIKLSTDSTETNFTVSNVDMSNLQIMLSMFGPNEYN